MSLKFRVRSQDESPQMTPADSVPGEVLNRPRDYRNVTVTHGIHRGTFPVGGMLIKDARRVLEKLINIDASALPVVNGAPVDENTRITEAITMLSFVKPSSMKGMAEMITIQGDEVQLISGSGERHTLGIGLFAQGIASQTVHGLHSEPLADNVKWLVSCGNVSIYVIELKPELRWIKWLSDDSPAPYGPAAKTTDRQLATPYVVLKVPFRKGTLVSRVEVFYRNEPLSCLDGPGGALYWPNLLNVSPHSYDCIAWFCTQYLRSAGLPGSPQAMLDATLHHLWGGSFNASSEAHEGKSTYSLAREQKLDARVTDVVRWEAESRRDPRFALCIDWKPTGYTVRKLIEKELRFQAVPLAPNSVAALGNILLKKQKPK